MFTHLEDIVEHKRNYCKLRFACKCGPRTNYDVALARSKPHLLCKSCHVAFADPWELLWHAQSEHKLDIFVEEKEEEDDEEFNED